MASAIHQLIAQQQGPNILGSALQGLAAASQEKQQAQENELNKQRITLGQRQLANADRQIAEQHQEKSEKFAANLAYQIRNERDPARKAQLFMSGREAAANSGLDTSKWPQQYNDQAQAGLDVIFNKVYGGEILKADLEKKPTGPTSSVGKLMADREKAIKDGASPETIAAYDAAIKKENYIAPPKAAGADDGYHPPLMTSTGILNWDASQKRYVPMMDGDGKPYLPQGVDATVQAAVAGAKARGKEEGGATGEAVVQSALVGQNVAEIQSTIDQLRNHKGLGGITGMMGAIPNAPGSDAADAEALREQLGGRAFLQARQALKGGGQITDFEGQKAEQAFVRMKKAQSKKQFLAALDEYETHVKNGYEILRQQAKGDFSTPNVNANKSGPAQIKSDADYNALPSGAEFIAPDGSHRRKP